jgi:hypothetical protein
MVALVLKALGVRYTLRAPLPASVPRPAPITRIPASEPAPPVPPPVSARPGPGAVVTAEETLVPGSVSVSSMRAKLVGYNHIAYGLSVRETMICPSTGAEVAAATHVIHHVSVERCWNGMIERDSAQF